MLKLQGERIYLAALEREDWKKLHLNMEYDFDNPTETVGFGLSVEQAEARFEEIQKKVKKGIHVYLGVFLNDGEVIGDVVLQRIDKTNRSCSLGMGFAKAQHRNTGYGTEAAKLALRYGFHNLGLERIWASTYEINTSAQKLMEKTGFTLEGVHRKAVYFCGRRVDEHYYGILKDEFEANRK
ncbi:MAG: GNAT family N-acetyltransferase [Defluviitaleaceae bacterium]|nr:GNAT family N-acetyltransferase [Defluviitaleaceae bacterium]